MEEGKKEEGKLEEGKLNFVLKAPKVSIWL